MRVEGDFWLPKHISFVERRRFLRGGQDGQDGQGGQGGQGVQWQAVSTLLAGWLVGMESIMVLNVKVAHVALGACSPNHVRVGMAI